MVIFNSYVSLPEGITRLLLAAWDAYPQWLLAAKRPSEVRQVHHRDSCGLAQNGGWLRWLGMAAVNNKWWMEYPLVI